MPASYTALNLSPKGNSLQGPRPLTFTVVSHRTKHGPFISYLRRFNKTGLPLCAYGTPREARHLLYCPLTGPLRSRITKSSKARCAGDLYKTLLGPKALGYLNPLVKIAPFP